MVVSIVVAVIILALFALTPVLLFGYYEQSKAARDFDGPIPLVFCWAPGVLGGLLLWAFA